MTPRSCAANMRAPLGPENQLTAARGAVQNLDRQPRVTGRKFQTAPLPLPPGSIMRTLTARISVSEMQAIKLAAIADRMVANKQATPGYQWQHLLQGITAQALAKFLSTDQNITARSG